MNIERWKYCAPVPAPVPRASEPAMGRQSGMFPAENDEGCLSEYGSTRALTAQMEAAGLRCGACGQIKLEWRTRAWERSRRVLNGTTCFCPEPTGDCPPLSACERCFQWTRDCRCEPQHVTLPSAMPARRMKIGTSKGLETGPDGALRSTDEEFVWVRERLKVSEVREFVAIESTPYGYDEFMRRLRSGHLPESTWPDSIVKGRQFGFSETQRRWLAEEFEREYPMEAAMREAERLSRQRLVEAANAPSPLYDLLLAQKQRDTVALENKGPTE